MERNAMKKATALALAFSLSVYCIPLLAFKLPLFEFAMLIALLIVLLT
jgi:hypothetical protein